jgi:hypothetical protein
MVVRFARRSAARGGRVHVNPIRRPRALAVCLALGSLIVAALPATAGGLTEKPPLRIEVLSNRADLVSGGDALVRVVVPAGTRLDAVRVRVGGRDVTQSFTLRAAGAMTGLITGLRLGRNELTARAKGGPGARITITNHPKGGPVFSGPQIQPWVCTTEDNGLGPATDAQCNAPTEITYLYQPEGADPGAYEAYDPASPPDDVATTTTDTGRKVPYILRQERGTVDRSIYKLLVLADPSKPWTGTRPQATWNRKLFVAFGGGCGTQHKQMPPNDGDPIFGVTAANGAIQQQELLSRGWMAAATGMNTLNYNCNEVVSAEALMMTKEHIIEQYGSIRRTVSVGGSGGSVQQLSIATAYPGLLDGIVPTQTFPDLWNMVWDSAECYLFQHYFTLVSPHLWATPAQQAAVTGKTGQLACTEFVALFADAFDPQNRGPYHVGKGVRFGCELTPGQAYHPLLNPTGPRCSVQDYQRNIWGHGGPGDAAPLVFDNAGVQYGLKALNSGAITIDQFLDLNEKVGSLDNEGEFTATRSSMTNAMARTMYRSGRASDPRQLAHVPILDVRQFVSLNTEGDTYSDMHQPFFSRVLRARLDAVNGTHGNLVYWLAPPDNPEITAVRAVDRWLDRIDADGRSGSKAAKIIRNRPRDLVDTCWIDGQPVKDPAACAQNYTVGSDPRIQAGALWRQDNRKCQRKAPDRRDYKVAFADAQWARLLAAFPGGVCDWARPSVGYQPSVPWISYASAPGGRAMGPAPVSRPL